MSMNALQELKGDIVACCRCGRLVDYRRRVAREKRRAYRDCHYWGKPVPPLGSDSSKVLLLGLAPAAHGANRTGRIFTGDRSGDFLFATLYRFGFCNQPTSQSQNDGLELSGVFINSALRCAPPQNKPLGQELQNCESYLLRELRLLRRLKVVVALGQIAWSRYLSARRKLGQVVPRPLPRFGHGQIYDFGDGIMLIGSYHPSQQNTQTGRLTQEMFDHIFEAVRSIVGPAAENVPAARTKA